MLDLIQINVNKQQLLGFTNKQLVCEFLVSTSKFGVGEIKDSFCTPCGLHYIHSKFGADLPPFAIFKAREFTGHFFDEYTKTLYPNDDWILTRILWLSGLESGKNLGGNVDTLSRFIYIHGTHDELHIGTPTSHGCIRMRNLEIIKLFDITPIHCYVEII